MDGFPETRRSAIAALGSADAEVRARAYETVLGC